MTLSRLILIISTDRQIYIQKNCFLCHQKLFGQKYIEIINKALYAKYPASQNYFYTVHLNAIIDQERTPFAIFFKDLTCLIEEEENLRRYYKFGDIEMKMTQLVSYYEYHVEIPRIYIFKAINTLEWFHQKKRKLCYKKMKEDQQLDISEHFQPVKQQMILGDISECQFKDTLQEVQQKLNSIILNTSLNNQSQSFAQNSFINYMKDKNDLKPQNTQQSQKENKLNPKLLHNIEKQTPSQAFLKQLSSQKFNFSSNNKEQLHVTPIAKELVFTQKKKSIDHNNILNMQNNKLKLLSNNNNSIFKLIQNQKKPLQQSNNNRKPEPSLKLKTKVNYIKKNIELLSSRNIFSKNNSQNNSPWKKTSLLINNSCRNVNHSCKNLQNINSSRQSSRHNLNYNQSYVQNALLSRKFSQAVVQKRKRSEKVSKNSTQKSSEVFFINPLAGGSLEKKFNNKIHVNYYIRKILKRSKQQYRNNNKRSTLKYLDFKINKQISKNLHKKRLQYRTNKPRKKENAVTQSNSQ